MYLSIIKCNTFTFPSIVQGRELAFGVITEPESEARKQKLKSSKRDFMGNLLEHMFHLLYLLTGRDTRQELYQAELLLRDNVLSFLGS